MEIPKKYRALFQAGLTTGTTYLKLFEWDMGEGMSFTAAIQPTLQRTSETHIWVGGKLRVKYNEPSEEKGFEALVQEFVNIQWQNKDYQRLSCMFGGAYESDSYDAKGFKASNFHTKVIAQLEEALGVTFENKMQITLAYKETLDMQMADNFIDPDEAITKLEAKIAEIKKHVSDANVKSEAASDSNVTSIGSIKPKE